MSEVGKLLGDVNPCWVFRTCNGVVLHNLYDLKHYLEGCSDYDFRYHVNMDHAKNDFAIWVREVVQDQVLAKELDGKMIKDRYLREVVKRIRKLESQP